MPAVPPNDPSSRQLREVRGADSLKVRITLGALGVLIGGISFLAWYTTRTLHESLQQRIGEQQFAAVSIAASHIDGELRERLQALHAVASALPPDLAANRPRAQAVLDSYKVLHHLFPLGLHLAGPDGALIASVPPIADAQPDAGADRAAVDAVLAGACARIGPPRLDPATGAPTVTLAVPVRGRKGKPAGALIGVPDLGENGLIGPLDERRFGWTGRYYVIDAETRLVLSAGDPARVMTPFAPRGSVAAIDRIIDGGQEGPSLYFDLAGVEVLSSSRRVPAAGWVVHTLLPARDAFASIEVAKQRVVLAALGLAALMGLLMWGVLRRELAPMLDAARELAGFSRTGQAPSPLQVAKRDEVGQLFESFNRLLAMLAGREAALRESEERYRVAFETSPDAISISRWHDAVCLAVNTGYTAVTGWRAEDVVGRRITEVGVWRNPADRARIVQLVQEHGSCVNYECEYVARDGAVLTMLVSAHQLDFNGERCIMTISRDITARKAAELRTERVGRLYAALSACNHAIVDDAGEQALFEEVCRIVIEVARLKMAWIGLVDPASGLVRPVASAGDGTDYLDGLVISIDASREEGRGPTARAIRQNVPVWIQDFVHDPQTVPWRDRARRYRWAASAALPLVRGGVVAGALMIYAAEPNAFDDEIQRLLLQMAEDISRALRTTDLQRARRQADAASDAKSAFIANMSHEIRTPLNAVIGLAHMLLRDGPAPGQVPRLRQIESSGQHLLAVVNDILDLSKIEAGRLELNETVFDLDAALLDVQLLMEPPAREKGLDLTFDAGAAPRWVRGDPTRLKQALINYVGNAIKFTAAGHVTVRSRAQPRGDGTVLMHFEVEDTGIGIAEDQLALLFQPFEQVDASTSREFGGTGLGLAITKHLAGMMGGAAGAQSEPGEGSIFWFTARLGIADEPAAALPPSATPAEVAARHAGARVLLVEDHPIAAEVSRDLLEQAGLAVDHAKDGAEAIEMARGTPYDLVLMDRQLPRLDGLEATRAIRRLPGWQSRPIVALTANVFAEDRRLCLAAGMTDFLGKPVRPEELYAVLMKVLEPSVRAIATLPRATPEPGADDGLEAIARLPGMNPDRVRDFRGRADKYVRLLREAAAMHARDVERLADRLAGGDTQGALEIAHSIKGGAGMLGAAAVMTSAWDLEVAIAGREGSAAVQARLEAVRAALAALAAAMP